MSLILFPDARIKAFQPGTKVEITTGVIKGERATVAINPETGSHIQKCDRWTEVWIRYEKDGQKVGMAILLPVWEDIDFLRVI